MVERIRTLLDTRQLTPTQFADSIGIARPIVSHILSGRNKPSLEVVQRILAAMPDLSMPWLLNGTGPMLAANTPPLVLAPQPVAPAAEEAVPEPARTPFPAASPAKLAPAARVRRPIAENNASTSASTRFGGVAAASGPKRFAPLPPQSKPLQVEPLLLAQPTPGAAAGAPVSALPSAPTGAIAAPAAYVAPEAGPVSLAEALSMGADKPIRRIVIFYRDGSFADYQPE